MTYLSLCLKYHVLSFSICVGLKPFCWQVSSLFAAWTDTRKTFSCPRSDLGCHGCELKLVKDQGQQERQKLLNSKIKQGRGFYSEGNWHCVEYAQWTCMCVLNVERGAQWKDGQLLFSDSNSHQIMMYILKEFNILDLTSIIVWHLCDSPWWMTEMSYTHTFFLTAESKISMQSWDCKVLQAIIEPASTNSHR